MFSIDRRRLNETSRQEPLNINENNLLFFLRFFFFRCWNSHYIVFQLRTDARNAICIIWGVQIGWMERANESSCPNCLVFADLPIFLLLLKCFCFLLLCCSFCFNRMHTHTHIYTYLRTICHRIGERNEEKKKKQFSFVSVWVIFFVLFLLLFFSSSRNWRRWKRLITVGGTHTHSHTSHEALTHFSSSVSNPSDI